MEAKDLASIIIAGCALFASCGSLYLAFLTWRYVSRSVTYSAIMGRLFAINQLEVDNPHLFERLYQDYQPSALVKGGNGLSHYVFMVFNLYAEI